MLLVPTGGWATTTKRVVGITAGFALALAVAALAVWVRYLGVDPRDVAASSGMYAGGDAILFVGVAATLSLVPALFLLHWGLQAYPRGMPKVLLGLSLSGPLCWVLFLLLGSDSLPLPAAIRNLEGLLVVTVIGPRIVASPIAFLFVAVAMRMVRERESRRLLSVGLLLEALPIALFVIRMLRALA
jgi:hypothetical protein